MIKESIFSSSRFMNLCRKEMVEGWKINLLRVVVLYGIMAVFFLFVAFIQYRSLQPNFRGDPMVEFSEKSFVIFGWIFGLIFASMAFSNLKTKTSRLAVLMTPATPFEKFFSRWMVYTLVYLLVFILVFMVADYTRVLITSWVFPNSGIQPTSLRNLFMDSSEENFLPGSNIGFLKYVFTYLLLQSFFFLGSVIWPKNSFIKTFVAGLIIIITYSLLTAYVIKLFVIHENVHVLISIDRYLEAKQGILWGILIYFILFNWIIAYYRFKESEIINRL